MRWWFPQRCVESIQRQGCTRDLTEHLLSVHDLVSAEFAPGKGRNAVHQNQLDVVVNNARFQSLQLPSEQCSACDIPPVADWSTLDA